MYFLFKQIKQRYDKKIEKKKSVFWDLPVKGAAIFRCDDQNKRSPVRHTHTPSKNKEGRRKRLSEQHVEADVCLLTFFLFLQCTIQATPLCFILEANNTRSCTHTYARLWLTCPQEALNSRKRARCCLLKFFILSQECVRRFARHPLVVSLALMDWKW